MYIFLCVLAIALYYYNRNAIDIEKAKKQYIGIMTFVLCLVAALKNYAVGNDTYQYYTGFNDSLTTPWSTNFENIKLLLSGQGYFIHDPGYSLIVKCFASIIPSFEVFTFCLSLILISAIGKVMYILVDNFKGYVLGYCYYITLMYFNIPNNLYRQALAMGLILWASIFVLENAKLWKALLLVLLAYTCHKSALIGVIPILLYYFNKPKLLYKAAIVLCPLIFIFGSRFVDVLILYANSERYQIYSGLGEEGAKPIMYIAQMLLIYVIGSLSYKSIPL